MEKQRSQAIESLEISNHSVKCQKCGLDIPLIGKLTKPKSNRITILEKRIKWLEGGYPRSYGGNNNKSSDDDNNGSSSGGNNSTQTN